MKIAIGCDHAGFPAKARIINELEALGAEVVDVGTDSTDSVDYPDFARPVAEAVADGRVDRGVVVCGSGVGVTVAANKVPGVRAAMCHDTYSAHQGVEHDAMNVLCLGARIIGEELIAEIVHAFVAAEFSGAARHVRRLNKVLDIESDALEGRLGSAAEPFESTDQQ